MITITNTNKHPDTDVLRFDIDEITRNVTIETNADNEKYVIGDGIFDNLMETATKHLDAQWNNQRIRGEQYAEVYQQIYMKTLELALNAWIQKPKAIADTLLTLDNIDKTNAEIANIEEQTVHEKLKEDLTIAQTSHEGKKELNTVQDTKVKVCQEKLTCAQATHEAEKQELTEAQVENVEADTLVKGCQKTLTCNQATHELEKAALTRKQLDLLGKQIEVEEKKVALYQAQAKGFEEDIKYKIFKTSLETWGMGFSVASSAFTQTPVPMSNACINRMAQIWFPTIFDGLQINTSTAAPTETDGNVNTDD